MRCARRIRRLRLTTLPAQHQRQIGVAERRGRIEHDRVAKALLRLAVQALTQQHTRERIVGRSDVGLGRKRKVQMLFSLFELIEPGQRLAEM
jgi:hypothetical protein